MSDERAIPTPGFFQRLFKDPEFTRCAEFLRGVALFQDLGRKDIGYLIQSLFKKEYAEGEELFEEGDIGRALFIVETGSVDLVKQGADGRGQVLANAGPGDFFGEMALIEELPRSAAAVARADTVVYLLYRTRLFGLVRSRPRVGVMILDQLVRLLSARLRSTSERLVSSAEVPAEAPADALPDASPGGARLVIEPS
ncbi:MAG: cyclic nucleotide-binding domain-containing protein [Acidobacteriota bacterium]|nr:cyclic nucleotide-binding domain-containing protein [Acidobacteriota bacterium]